MNNTFQIAAFAIILNEQKEILLCHRTDQDLWNLPGGGMDNRESPEECAIREVKEEVGIDVEISKLLGVYTKTEKDTVVFSFLCKKISGEVSLSDEADKIDFFPAEKLPKNMPSKQIERIQDFFQKKHPIFKNQI